MLAKLSVHLTMEKLLYFSRPFLVERNKESQLRYLVVPIILVICAHIKRTTERINWTEFKI
jgi:hypothetical protein